MGAPQVEFDGPLVGEPQEASHCVEQWQGNRVADRLGLVVDPAEPVGGILWTVAQVVRGSLEPRAVFEIGERDRCDLPVIVQQITLGEPCLRPVDFLQVRDLDRLVSQLPGFR